MLPQIQLLEFVNLQHAHKNTNDIVVRVGYFKVETKDTTIPLSTQQIRNLIEKYAQIFNLLNCSLVYKNFAINLLNL